MYRMWYLQRDRDRQKETETDRDREKKIAFPKYDTHSNQQTKESTQNWLLGIFILEYSDLGNNLYKQRKLLFPTKRK